MIVIKKELLDKLIEDMEKCKNCTSIMSRYGKDYSLVNIYKDKEFSKTIPSIWTDWYNRLDSSIMIIGQDWGPYRDMVRIHGKYKIDKTDYNWNNIIEEEKSSTKRQIKKYLALSSNGRVSTLDNIYFTNAIMCARKGENYRGDNINLKFSTMCCSSFLKRQIDIVKPKVIITLGYYPLLSLSSIYNFKIKDTLKDTIDSTPEIDVGKIKIIPTYHPVAQVKIQEQIKQYMRIWKYIK